MPANSSINPIPRVAAPLRCDDGEVAGFRCPLCYRAGESIGERDGYVLRQCRGRGSYLPHAPILLSWQWDSVAEYEALYTQPERYHKEMQCSEGQPESWMRDAEHLAAARARLQFLQTLMPSGTVLDIGAGTGAFVAMAQAFGYDAFGIEPSELANEAQKIGRTVKFGSWSSLNIHDSADIVTLHDVWEHLVSPVYCLKYLARLLRPGGLIVVEIPEWDCPQARQQGVLWRHVRPLQHVFLPSDDAARALFAMAGLQVEAMMRPRRGQIGKIAYYLSRPQL
jgi:SAM-dependent methyltransferase